MAFSSTTSSAQQQQQRRRREEAGSLTLPSPTESRLKSSATVNANKEVAECCGNVLLMEARLCEMTSSIRALVRSNHDLEMALLQESSNNNNDNIDNDKYDTDFLQAIEENKLAMRKQCYVAIALVKEMREVHQCNIELEDDIRQIVLKFSSTTPSTTTASASADNAPESNNTNNSTVDPNSDNNNTSAAADDNARNNNIEESSTTEAGIFL